MQDRWKLRPDLTLTLGLRYEDFGTSFNTLQTPAFTGIFNLSPVSRTGPFNQPNKVKPDNNNFAPTFGIAWVPTFKDGFVGWLFGEQKSVIRAGYQIGYDTFFNNIASNAAASSPNIVQASTPSVVAAGVPRGLANFSSRFPTVAPAVSPLTGQTLIDPNLVNRYYQRWSLGLQRDLTSKLMSDVSYVGSSGTSLYINEDGNPAFVNPALRGPIPTGYPNCTPGAAVTAGQATAQFPAGSLLSGSYTFSKLLSNGDEVFAVGVGTAASVAALPIILGGNRFEKGLSQNDRTHRGVLSYVYEIPFMRRSTGLERCHTGDLESAEQMTQKTQALHARYALHAR
jgi:hypothetical protein